MVPLRSSICMHACGTLRPGRGVTRAARAVAVCTGYLSHAFSCMPPGHGQRWSAARPGFAEAPLLGMAVAVGMGGGGTVSQATVAELHGMCGSLRRPGARGWSASVTPICGGRERTALVGCRERTVLVER